MRAVRGARADRPPRTITVDARGPLAFVEVTRALPAPRPARAGEALLDIALPEQSFLVAVEVRDRGRWRARLPPSGRARRRLSRREREPAASTPAAEPFDDTPTTGCASGAASAGRARRRPSATASRRPRSCRRPLPGAISGGAGTAARPRRRDRHDPRERPTSTSRARARGHRGGRRARGHASTRSGWEVSWAPRDAAPAAGAPTLDTRVAMATLSPTRRRWPIPSAAGRRAARGPPTSVLLVIDRSRSVGLPGLSAEHDLARRAAGGAAAEHALRRPVLRSRQQAAVPDEPPRDARGDRRAGGRDGARAHAERHRSGGGAARGGRRCCAGNRARSRRARCWSC